MVKWKADYEVGVKLIDEQHEKLFEIADRAYKLLTNDFILDKYDRITEILGELKEYTIFHFKSEEEYMLSVGYKKFLSHKVIHEDFIKSIDNLDLHEIDLNQDESVKKILEFVVDWIDKHILNEDKFIVEN
ncbi:bacteriohemerythrin [Clostridium beijerinckii]|jgi:hemerythrin-like metal-binding domain|uniref:Hemerythrin family protein n=2 Tax=Clostridium beijerinckii TaxID=1520 RepID=A0AAE2RUN7_CLOBE|nr:hemerythrin family protein [Clostridium beijerinckii]ABR35552.1 hemerythrin-like metal-binding protein [Clostridium beijerinckii NCIMB 8052]AIU04353.1 hemerythrin-like metal-binding protein [Clostridium beijerinckii ATCC 35702]MBF7809808.1 hemerythrin family protein [Clostridium beijerinckii]NOW90385.1 hemerythrin [Clostridium beijerinckii]NRT69404.1 hemerythrin [Clostridium beijerinckii]